MKYTALGLIEDLRKHIGSNHSDFLAKIFPNRINKFGYNSLSLLWGKERSYLNGVIYKLTRNEPNFKFPEKSIRQLIKNLKIIMLGLLKNISLKIWIKLGKKICMV